MIRRFFLAAGLAGLAGCAAWPSARPAAGASWRAAGAASRAYDFDWRLSGDPAVAPMQVFDDGRETWLQFAPGQPVPAIFGVDAAGERVLPYARRDPYVVLAGRWDGLAFRGGRLAARARRASCLPREGRGACGSSPTVQGADNPL
ncbi:TrbG/VirB9 family P-type conjugative transfer protein [Achromobacter sp. 2789STDY5608621]|uniref:TrbG/VirB9 family P-type conjugative transfer protein n=1 Tax=Achromobacter sp. 2789STDY5608621 TaxID=1806496 RepID=UPI0006C70DE7|nr:TrbG/VirB9 family P-type conjugative transfer protein [Achromobacter sp. 2789STDY5608621]CUI72462.1 Pertussis toxin liberation protein F [Achromobacter sp. 2789STDY5608621]